MGTCSAASAAAVSAAATVEASGLVTADDAVAISNALDAVVAAVCTAVIAV